MSVSIYSSLFNTEFHQVISRSIVLLLVWLLFPFSVVLSCIFLLSIYIWILNIVNRSIRLKVNHYKIFWNIFIYWSIVYLTYVNLVSLASVKMKPLTNTKLKEWKRAFPWYAFFLHRWWHFQCATLYKHFFHAFST